MSFTEAITSLADTVQSINAASSDFFSTEIPQYATSTKKFLKAYLSLNEKGHPDIIHDAFNEVFEEHISEISTPIIDSEGSMNDDWIKKVKAESRKKSKRISLTDLQPQGLTIKLEDRKSIGARIPITEIYKRAVQIYEQKKGEGKFSDLPFRFLSCLYQCFLTSLSPKHQIYAQSLTSNIQELENIIQNFKADEKETGGIFEKLGSFVNKLTGNGDKEKFDLNKLKHMADGILDPEHAQKLHQSFDVLQRNIEEKGDLIEGFKSSMEDPLLKPLIREGTEKLKQSLQQITGDEQVVQEPAGAIAADQE